MNSKEKAYIDRELKKLHARRRAFKTVEVAMQSAHVMFTKACRSIPLEAGKLDSLSIQVAGRMGLMQGMASCCAVEGDDYERAVLASLEAFQRKLKARDAQSSVDRVRGGAGSPRNAKPSLLVPAGKSHSSRNPTKTKFSSTTKKG